MSTEEKPKVLGMPVSFVSFRSAELPEEMPRSTAARKGACFQLLACRHPLIAVNASTR